MIWLKKGADFLPDFSKVKLKQLYNKEKNAKAKLRLLAAIQRKDGKTLDDISHSLQKPKMTIGDWLRRFVNKGIPGIYDIKQPGKPARLTEKQLKELDEILDVPPLKQNIPFVIWTTNLVQYIIFKQFNVEIKVRQVRNIVKKINFTIQIPRPENRKSNKELQEKFKIELKKKFNIMLNLDSRSSVLMRHSSK